MQRSSNHHIAHEHDYEQEHEYKKTGRRNRFPSRVGFLVSDTRDAGSILGAVRN
jgi:hypothetical protein